MIAVETCRDRIADTTSDWPISCSLSHQWLDGLTPSLCEAVSCTPLAIIPVEWRAEQLTALCPLLLLLVLFKLVVLPARPASKTQQRKDSQQFKPKIKLLHSFALWALSSGHYCTAQERNRPCSFKSHWPTLSVYIHAQKRKSIHTTLPIQHACCCTGDNLTSCRTCHELYVLNVQWQVWVVVQ